MPGFQWICSRFVPVWQENWSHFSSTTALVITASSFSSMLPRSCLSTICLIGHLGIPVPCLGISHVTNSHDGHHKTLSVLASRASVDNNNRGSDLPDKALHAHQLSALGRCHAAHRALTPPDSDLTLVLHWCSSTDLSLIPSD